MHNYLLAVKNLGFWYIIFLPLVSACLSDTDPEADLEAPQIRATDGQAEVQPGYFASVPAGATEIPLVFTVTDQTGIKEIKIESHTGFDGHTHGRIARNNNFKLFSHFQIIREEAIPNPQLFISNPQDGIKIYLDERNPNIAAGDLLLAGPYHFSIQATDRENNETSYQNNSIYHTTLYLQRAYAPRVELTTLDIPGRKIKGHVARNTDHPASSDIVFLWVYITNYDASRPNQEGSLVKEWIWGESAWPHLTRPNKGVDLPGSTSIDLETLFQNNAEFFSQLQNNRLVIWAEDANNNITVKHFNQ